MHRVVIVGDSYLEISFNILGYIIIFLIYFRIGRSTGFCFILGVCLWGKGAPYIEGPWFFACNSFSGNLDLKITDSRTLKWEAR